MGPGVDPHAYRQTRTDIVAMTKADLVLWHGLYLEAQMEEFMRDLAQEAARGGGGRGLAEGPCWSLMTPMPTSSTRMSGWTRACGARWWSPCATRSIRREPGGRGHVFEAKPRPISKEIANLAAYAETCLSTVPPASRVLVTAHDAFNYFGLAYGFEVLGIQGISTESEAGLGTRRRTGRSCWSHGRSAPCSSSPRSPTATSGRLIEGAAARGHTVSIGGELFSDAMGDERHLRGHLYRHDRPQRRP